MIIKIDREFESDDWGVVYCELEVDLQYVEKEWELSTWKIMLIDCIDGINYFSDSEPYRFVDWLKNSIDNEYTDILDDAIKSYHKKH